MGNSVEWSGLNLIDGNQYSWNILCTSIYDPIKYTSQVPPRSSSSSLRTVVIHEDSEDDEPNNAKSQEVLTGNSGLPAGNTSLATGNRKQSPVKSIRSNTLVPSPARVRSRPAPPLPASSPPPSPPPPPRKSPLLTSAGSRDLSLPEYWLKIPAGHRKMFTFVYPSTACLG